MKHSPIIVWSLLAATLAVDVVAIVWIVQAGPLSAATFLYDALVSSQLAIVALWAVFSAERPIWGWLATIAAVLAASLATARVGILSLAETCGIYGSYVAALAVALWIVKRSGYWQRLAGVAPTAWQFSLTLLLAAMTLVAVLIVTLRTSPLVSGAGDLWRFITVLTLGDVVAVVATLLLWAAHRGWLTRLATVCAAAMVLGALEAASNAWGYIGANLITSLSGDMVPFIAYAIILSLVVFVWLELTPLVPHAGRDALARRPPGPEP